MKIYEEYLKEVQDLKDRMNTSITMMIELINEAQRDSFLEMLSECVFCDKQSEFVQLQSYSMVTKRFYGLSDMMLPKEYELEDIPLDVRLYMLKILDIKVHDDFSDLVDDDNVGQDPDYYDL